MNDCFGVAIEKGDILMCSEVKTTGRSISLSTFYATLVSQEKGGRFIVTKTDGKKKRVLQGGVRKHIGIN